MVDSLANAKITLLSDSLNVIHKSLDSLNARILTDQNVIKLINEETADIISKVQSASSNWITIVSIIVALISVFIGILIPIYENRKTDKLRIEHNERLANYETKFNELADSHKLEYDNRISEIKMHLGEIQENSDKRFIQSLMTFVNIYLKMHRIDNVIYKLFEILEIGLKSSNNKMWCIDYCAQAFTEYTVKINHYIVEERFNSSVLASKYANTLKILRADYPIFYKQIDDIFGFSEVVQNEL